MENKMKLIGYIFIDTQDEFEEWQIANPGHTVHTVIPHMREISMWDNRQKYDPGTDCAPKWGVFVTYSYEAIHKDELKNPSEEAVQTGIALLCGCNGVLPNAHICAHIGDNTQCLSVEGRYCIYSSGEEG